jgi:hypothetical protein
VVALGSSLIDFVMERWVASNARAREAIIANLRNPSANCLCFNKLHCSRKLTSRCTYTTRSTRKAANTLGQTEGTLRA